MTAGELTEGLARITPDVTLAALAGVREGRVIDLTRVISGRLPRHDGIRPAQRYLSSGLPVADQGVTVTHDYMLASTHLGTHIDALGHIGRDGAFFGGRGPDELTLGGLRTLGADRYTAVVTRGVLLDLSEPGMEPPVGQAAIEAWAARVELRSGDVVIVHEPDPLAPRAGKLVDVSAATWLVRAGMAAIACAGLSIESEGSLDLHVTLLKDHGVPILEGLELTELVAAAVPTVALFIGMVRSRGASGAWASVAAVL